MAKSATTTTEVASDARPRLVIALGKQTRGKTLILRWLAERGAKDRTRPLRLFDADPHNPTLSRHFDDVQSPDSTSLEDRRVWLERRIREQRDGGRNGQPFNAILDVGGGDLLMGRLAHEVRFTETIDMAGVDLVCIYMLGPNIADLEYFQMLDDSGFKPKHLAIVFNGGLVSGDRDPVQAFDLMVKAPLVDQLLKSGAVPVFMPALAADCLEAVDQSGARTFHEAIPLLEMWDEMRLETWLNQAMEDKVAKPLAKMGWLV